MGVNINVLTLVALTSGTKDPKILLDTSEFVPKTFYVGCGTRSTYVRASREAYLNRLEYAGWRARERRDGQRVRAVVLDSIIVLSNALDTHVVTDRRRRSGKRARPKPRCNSVCCLRFLDRGSGDNDPHSCCAISKPTATYQKGL